MARAAQRWPEYFAEPTAPTLAPGVEQPRIIPDRITVDRGRVQELLDSGWTTAEAQRKAVEEARATAQEGY
jgi:hypothetical protein